MEIQWPLVVFTALAGVGSWLMACTVFGHLFAKTKIKGSSASILGIVSVVLLVAGGIASVLHLTHPERVLEALGHPTSGIFLEALFLGILSVLILVYLVMVRRVEETSTALKVVGAAILAVALAYTYILGSSYMMASRPVWNTPLLPLSYAFTTAATGAALYLCVIAYRKEETDAVKLGSILLLGAGVLGIVVTALYALVGGIADQAVLYWGGVVAVGLGVPAVCGYLAWKNPENAFAYAAAALLAASVGTFSFRASMWLTGTVLQDLLSMPRL